MKRANLTDHAGDGPVTVTVVIHDGPTQLDVVGAYLSCDDAEAAADELARDLGSADHTDYNEHSGSTIDFQDIPLA